nr:2-succinyl-5-enolpyruvyl-6-hydroxy-3-cyclohexene-1-carboxylic-acid synthase [Ornithinimicrobium sp. F0845]
MATVLVDELVRCGVREVVLAPGSRSAPLAYAVQQAERAGRLRLHVRVDERSAGFLALGLAKVSRRPAVVITTSGTAVANLHPAVLEAHHASVPLVVLSADRPEELRGTGANQTTVQPGIFGRAVRWEHDLTSSWGSSVRLSRDFGEILHAHPGWRTTVDRAWAAAVGALGGTPGPVHLNVAFRDPLAPDLDASPALPTELAGRADGAPWTAVPTTSPQPRSGGPGAGERPDPVPTLMVLGDLPDPRLAEEALTVAVARGWPVVAEPFGAGDRGTVLPHGSLLLTAEDWLDDHLPERVLLVGRCTLNRETGALLRRPAVRVEAVTPTGTWPDPSHAVAQVHPWGALAEWAADEAGPPEAQGSWATLWHRAGQAVAEAVRPLLEDSWPSGPFVARTVLDALADEDLLVLGSSNAARDADRAGLAGRRLLVTGNRGLAGIDGTNATAVGIALAAPDRRVVSLVGDLTFLHDVNGLLLGPDEPRPDLTVVVLNDDGGGIFGTLEYGEPARAGDFERVFGTPTGADLSAVATAYSLGFERVGSAGELRAALHRPAEGIRVIEVVVPRDGQRALRERLTQAAAAALG